MYTRMKANPLKYFKQLLSEAQILQRLEAICKEKLNELEQADMIVSSIDRVSFSSTLLGQLMARWYLSFDTVKEFSQIKSEATFEDFLDIFSRAAEWKSADLHIKPGDKVRHASTT